MKSDRVAKKFALENRIKDLFSKDLLPEPVTISRSTGDYEATNIAEAKVVSALADLAGPSGLLATPLDQEEQKSIENVTIEILSMQRFWVGIEADASQVDDAFRNAPELVGVIVQNQGQLHGVISRRRFYELLGRTFGVSIFLRRPIQTMLANLEIQSLIVPSSSLIAETVHLALGRPTDQIYDPILVSFANGEYYLSLTVLDFTSHSRTYTYQA